MSRCFSIRIVFLRLKLEYSYFSVGLRPKYSYDHSYNTEKSMPNFFIWVDFNVLQIFNNQLKKKKTSKKSRV